MTSVIEGFLEHLLRSCLETEWHLLSKSAIHAKAFGLVWWILNLTRLNCDDRLQRTECCLPVCTPMRLSAQGTEVSLSPPKYFLPL